MCHSVLVFFSPFSIAITSLGEERANLSAFRTFLRFVLVWICRFPLPLGVWEGLRFVIVALPGLFSYLFFILHSRVECMHQLERVVCPPEEGSEVGPLTELDEPSLRKTIIKKLVAYKRQDQAKGLMFNLQVNHIL